MNYDQASISLLSPNLSLGNYKQHLADKYGGRYLTGTA
jgi:hypothetical protein